MPEAPAEVLEVPHGLLSRTRESDADQLVHAVGASLDHLRQWLSWATEEAADVQVQRRRCREAEARWADGSEYAYVLRNLVGWGTRMSRRLPGSQVPLRSFSGAVNCEAGTCPVR